MTRQAPSAPVSGSGPRDRIKPAEDVRLRWSFAEASVWTDRMLTALEQGVKGGKWFSLMDKMYSEENLFWSWVKVAQNKGTPGVDHVTIEGFAKQLPHNLKRLTTTLREGTYRPQHVKRVWIPKPGSKEQRPLGVPTVRDRVVQTALRNVIEPIFEKDFAATNAVASVPGYGFRPGRGCKEALRRVDQLRKNGYRYVMDADLKSYFDTIPHERLLHRIAEKISDGPARPGCLATKSPGESAEIVRSPRRNNPPVAVLELIAMFLRQGVLDGLSHWEPETGSPHGAVISPLLSNISLDPLDHLMAQRGYEMVRYADDFVILCRTAEQAEAALAGVQQWTSENGLTRHPQKTRIVDAEGEAFEFLGYRFDGAQCWPRKKSLEKLQATLRRKTKRTNGTSLPCPIADVNRTLNGWFEYFKHSHHWTFTRLDDWLRMRLRSILRKRSGRKGRGRGWDHHRWKNSFFAEQGLFNLTAAHARACRSSCQVQPPTGEPCAGDPHARFGGGRD